MEKLKFRQFISNKKKQKVLDIKLNKGFIIVCILAVLLVAGCGELRTETTSYQYKTPKNFNEALSTLDTPQKLSSFMRQYFSYEERGGCYAYTPQQFFELRRGDCKDYSAFSSLLLSYHGYDAKMLCFDIYDRKGVRTSGHVVTVFQDTDGSLKYMNLYKIESGVSSIQDILEREKIRLNCSRIGNYALLPAGSTFVCPYYKPWERK